MPQNLKGCLYLQRRFAYIGHAMAVLLKEKYGVNQFCAYTDLRSSFEFLQSQKDFEYSDILLDQDIHKTYANEPLDVGYLNQLEKEYGLPNLWPYIENYRIVRYGLFLREYPHDTPPYTHKEMMRAVQVKAKAIIKFFKEEKPDFLIISVLADISTMLVYQVAKKMGVKTFFTQTARIGPRYTINEEYGTLSYVEKIFEELQTNENAYPKELDLAKNFLNQFRDNPKPHSKKDSPKERPINRKKQFSFLLPQNIFTSIRWAVKIWTYYIFNPHRDDYIVVKPWHYFWDRLKRKVRILIGFEDLYDAVTEEDYALFPLQLEPEMSHTLFAPFYNELKKIPNVKLIHPETSNFELIKNSKLIVAITSTAAWEGVLLKKPVITFGNVFYNAMPMVKKCVAIETLPEIVKSQLENFKYDEQALLNLIAAIYKESTELDLAKIWDVEGGGQMEKHEKEISFFIDLIASKLYLKPTTTI